VGTDDPRGSRTIRNAWIALVITAALWAAQSVAAKATADFVPPAFLAFVRWLVTLAVVLPFAWREILRERASIMANWRVLLLLGVMSTTLQNMVFYWGIKLSTATNAALLNSTVPIWILILSALLFKRRTSHGEWAGVAVSLSGVLLIMFGGSPVAGGGFAINPGDLLLAAGLVNWSLYSVLVPRRPVHLSSWAFITIISVIGVVVALPVLPIEWAFGVEYVFNGTAIAGILYMALLGTVIGTATYNYAIDRLGPAKAGFGVHLVPVWGMVLAFLLLGERPTLLALAGFALVLAGIGLGQTARREGGR